MERKKLLCVSKSWWGAESHLKSMYKGGLKQKEHTV